MGSTKFGNIGHAIQEICTLTWLPSLICINCPIPVGILHSDPVL